MSVFQHFLRPGDLLEQIFPEGTVAGESKMDEDSSPCH